MVVRRLVPFVAVIAAIALAADLRAHGGQYRGPWNSPVPPSTGGPGGPAGPGPAPNTGGRPTITDGTSWQVWWEYNKDDLIADDVLAPADPISGSDEFYLGSRRVVRSRDSKALTENDRKDRIAVALAAALRGDDNRDIVTACLVALAKVGIDPAGATLPGLFGRYLAAGDQEVRETAALAHGIAGQQAAQPVLRALLRGDSNGRALVGGKDVPDRTRTFAAWSLGLLAGRSRDAAEKRAAATELLAVLHKKDENSRDLRVGLIEGIGLVAPDGARSSAEKRLLWETVGELWKYYGLDLGKGDQLIQAHVPIAIARLLGRGTDPEQQRAKALLVEELFADGRSNQIRQSAAMALGSLCVPAEVAATDEQYLQALVRGFHKCTDQLTRYFCALSLGRIGGAQARSMLLTLYVDSNKLIERPWIALSLGLIARQRLCSGVPVDDELGRLLLRDLETIEFPDARSGLALALGLCGYRDAAPTLLGYLREGGPNETLLGYLAVSLALLGCTEAGDDLVALMRKSLRRPFVLQQCALALGRLGDARTVPILLEMLDDNQSTAALSAVAMALAQIRDRRSIDPLIAALADKERTALARAFAAAALGGVGDKDALPWNAVIARNMNWMATVDTLTNGSNGVLDIL